MYGPDPEPDPEPLARVKQNMSEMRQTDKTFSAMSDMASSSELLFFFFTASAHPLHRRSPLPHPHLRFAPLRSPSVRLHRLNPRLIALASVNGRPSSRPAAGDGGSRRSKSKLSSRKKGKGKGKGMDKAANPWNDSGLDDDDDVDRSPRSSTPKRNASSPGGKKNPRESGVPRQNPDVDLIPRRNLEEDSHILVSGSMPVETEQVLQTQEPASTPLWQTFVSSLSGVWRGVGAAFSPITAEMEAIALGDNEEMLYDCRIHSTIYQIQGEDSKDYVHRKTIWAVGNPLGEKNKGKPRRQEIIPLEDIDEEYSDGQYDSVELDLQLSDEDDIFVEEFDPDMHSGSDTDKAIIGDVTNQGLELWDDIILEEAADDTTVKLLNNDPEKGITTDLERKDLTYDTVMEEDVLELEPGLVLFEDGSYSRGPIELLTADGGEHTYKIEQCVVRGGHSRLRLVHTISIEEEEESIQILRVAVYEEEWMGPRNMKSISDSGGHHLKLFSQRPRLQQQDLVGTWKVFEMSATPVFSESDQEEESLSGSNQDNRPPFIHMTMETLKRRTLPEIPIHFVDEDVLDMQDVTMMWLPGGISAYVEIKGDGIFTVGVGWYEDGINLVMERDYTSDGRLYDVRSKTEVKGGWVGGRM